MKESIAKIGYYISQAFRIKNSTFEIGFDTYFAIGHVLIIALVLAAINFLYREAVIFAKLHEERRMEKNEKQHQD